MDTKNIPVEVKNRMAWTGWPGYIVCGNSDYTITFTFDEEWGEETAKTARFKFRTDVGVVHTDQPFIGDTVAVPVLTNTREVEVGVIFGDIATTTGATIRCVPCIRCGSGEATEYEKERFDELMQLFNDMLHGHDNKEALDAVTASTFQLLQSGAMVESVEVTEDDWGATVLRLKLLRQDHDTEQVAFIDLPIYGAEDRYLEADNSFGLGLDIGLTNYRPMPQISAAPGANGITNIYPDALYVFGEVDKLHIVLKSGGANYVNSFYFSFIAHDSTIFTLPAEVKWGGDNEIVVEGGKLYEVSIVNNLALWTSMTVEGASE